MPIKNSTAKPDAPQRSRAKLVDHGELYSVGDTTLDLRYGGNYGYSPRIDQWLNNKAYIPRDLVPLVITSPRMFELDGNGPQWTQTLKAFIELHCKKIEGYKATLTVNTASQQVRDEVQQDPTRGVRDRSDPVFSAVEKEGNPIQKFLEWWITYGILDPDSGRILASSLPKAPSDWLADWYTMSLLVFDPDTMFRHVRRAWVSVNMFPLTTGDIIGEKDPDNDKSILELSIGFSALTVTNEGTRQFAERIVKSISIKHALPANQKFWKNKQDDNINVQEGDVGYAAGVKDVVDAQLLKDRNLNHPDEPTVNT